MNYRVICQDHDCAYIGRVGKVDHWEPEVVVLVFGNDEEGEFFFNQVDATEDPVSL